MIKSHRFLIIFLFVITSFVNAQDYKFGKVSKEELSEKIHDIDSSAAAAVLYRSRKIRFEYQQGTGFKVYTSVHERVKIYNSAGFDYATISEVLYKNGSDKESVTGIKAFTFNLENGKIVKQKMAKSGVFSTSLNKYRNEHKFTLPNIKEGSVIEYTYQIISPFYYSIDEIDLQYDIPIKKQEVSIATPEYFAFKPNVKGYLALHPKYSSSNGKINFTTKTRTGGNGGFSSVGSKYSSSQIDYQIAKTEYAMENVPALKEEVFVNDMDNYRSAVNYELLYVQFPQSARESYATSWDKVIKKIYDRDSFGGQLRIRKYYKDALATIMSTTNSKAELADAIFAHVQDRMSWNKIYGYNTDNGVKEAYKVKSGNIADINLMLTSMLQSAGLDANPVLVSTRSHGVPLFPTREGFNYVVASVQLDGQTVLFDASNKFTKPNLLRTVALNWFGKLIKKDGTFSTVNLMPEKVSKENINMSVKLMANGDIEGKLRKTYTDYDAYLFRNKNSATNEEEYLEELENMNEGMEISEYTIKNKDIIGKPIMESYAFELESQADVVGDKIYFSPLFYMAMDENPFNLEKRNYPIDFTYPWQEKYIINIVIPEGYKVLTLPEDVNLALSENIGRLKYKIVDAGKNLQVMVDLKLNKAIIAASFYPDVKEIFKKAVEKQTEKVVLTKITNNGTTNSPEEGR